MNVTDGPLLWSIIVVMFWSCLESFLTFMKLIFSLKPHQIKITSWCLNWVVRGLIFVILALSLLAICISAWYILWEWIQLEHISCYTSIKWFLFTHQLGVVQGNKMFFSPSLAPERVERNSWRCCAGWCASSSVLGVDIVIGWCSWTTINYFTRTWWRQCFEWNNKHQIMTRVRVVLGVWI